MKSNIIRFIFILTPSLIIGIIVGKYFDNSYFFESLRRILVFNRYFVYGSFIIGFIFGSIFPASILYFFFPLDFKNVNTELFIKRFIDIVAFIISPMVILYTILDILTRAKPDELILISLATGVLLIGFIFKKWQK